MPSIVQVNVTQTVAPSPNNLQQTGALISVGGTISAPNSLSLLTQPSDLTPLLPTGLAITSLTWQITHVGSVSSGTYNAGTGAVTLTTSAPHGLVPGDLVTISGATGTGTFADIDGTFPLLAGTTGSTLVYDITIGLTLTITGAAFTTGPSYVLATTTAPHGVPIGTTFLTTVAGAVPAGYNGTFTATSTGASTFTYPLPAGPGSETTPGTYSAPGATELQQMVTTYFAQGFFRAVYVLELGYADPTTAVGVLAAYLIANPNTQPWQNNNPTLYALLVPRAWDGVTAFLDLVADYESTTAKLYFFVTTTLGTYTDYTDLMKDVFTLIEATGVSPTEFTCAAPFHVLLSYQPSNVSRVTPFAFAFVTGVTPFVMRGNSALLTTLKNAGVNVILTGAEGGISDTCVFWGTYQDGHDVTYWYSVDWVQIQAQLALANAVINGDNNPQAPLDYDQQGINVLQAVAQGVMNRGVQFALVLPPSPQVTAVPFNVYVVSNPSDYPAGIYRGLAVIYTPQRGFIQIVFNVQVSGFPVA
jgi:hypothetical protein